MDFHKNPQIDINDGAFLLSSKMSIIKTDYEL